MTRPTILIVEDNDVSRKMMRVTLEREGYTVVEAPDGATALAVAARKPPELIIHDLQLPDVRGIELVGRLRALPGCGGVPILACSGLLSNLEEARAAQAGFSDYLFKPVEPSHLRQIVGAHLPTTREEQEQPGRGKRVLVADDDSIMNKVVTLHLERLGFSVTRAADGMEALERARAEPPDAIVTDVLMPRLDGFRLCLAVRQDPRLARIPVVLVSSAFVDEEDRALGRRVGANAFVVRTHNFADVLEALLVSLREPPPAIPVGPVDVLAEEYSHRMVRQLERQMALNQDLSRRLAVRQVELGILANLTASVTSVTRPEAALRDMFFQALDAAAVSKGVVYLLGPGGSLALETDSGYREPDKPELARCFGHSGLIQRVLDAGEPVALSSAEASSNAEADLLTRAGAESLLIVPIVAGKERLGALLLASATRDLRQEWIAFGRAAGSQIGQALVLLRTFARVAAAEERYRLLFDANPYPMWVTDAETLKFLAVNEAALRHYGYSRDEFRAMTALDIYPPEDVPAVRALGLASLTGIVKLGEWRHRKKDGTLIEVEVARQTISFAERTAGLVLARDITDVKQAAREKESLEAQLRQAQKMEAVGRLAGGVAHDFNNLLTVIAGRSHFLIHRLTPDHPGRRDVELIQKSAERAAKLTRQLLAFSRKQILEPKVVDLGAVAKGIEPILQRLIGEDVNLAVVSHEGLGPVKADPGQIEQVILNLAINARDAMPRGGRLTIETANVELDETYTAGRAEVTPGPYVMLAVSDTGVGMDAATQARLFEPFFTTKEAGKGTGLGLATVYGIVKQSGGHIAVYSEPGRGSTFKIYLPCVEGAAAAAESVPVAAPPALGSETVLLVEDESDLRELAGEVLAARGYAVLQAGAPAEALQLAERHAGPIHLLVTDVVMPGMSGRELADRLLRAYPALRVLFMSGYTDTAIVHHAVLDPGTPFLHKPFTPDALARKVRDVLDQPRGH